jgi:hypothetical protein
VLAKLGTTLAPLALVSVGYQLRLAELRGRLAALSAGLAFKLLMGPALIMALSRARSVPAAPRSR